MLSIEDAGTPEPEGPQMDAVRVLFPPMPTICRFLSRSDLINLAEVCGLWEPTALFEKNRRYFIQKIRLCYKMGNLDRTLNVEPYMSLLFVDAKLKQYLSPEKQRRYLEPRVLAKRLSRRACHRTAVISVDECLTTDDPVLEGRPPDVKPQIHNGVLGLFFPKVETRLRVNATWDSEMLVAELSGSPGDQCTKKLHLGHTCNFNKSAVLVFIVPNETGPAFVVDGIREQLRDGMDSLWVTEIHDVGGVNCHCKKADESIFNQYILAMRISGPSFESWTESIDLTLPRPEVDYKLHQLRERVTLKTFRMGLLSGPHTTEYGTNADVMRSVKRIFPDIPFVGLFNHQKNTIRISENDSGLKQIFVEEFRKISLLIITYN